MVKEYLCRINILSVNLDDQSGTYVPKLSMRGCLGLLRDLVAWAGFAACRQCWMKALTAKRGIACYSDPRWVLILAGFLSMLDVELMRGRPWS